MPRAAFDRVTRRTHSPLSESQSSDSYVPRSPFSSPTLHRHMDPLQDKEHVFFSTYGAGSVSAASPAASLSSYSSSVQRAGDASCSGDQLLRTGSPCPPDPASTRDAIPSTMERLARRLSIRLPGSPLLLPMSAAAHTGATLRASAPESMPTAGDAALSFSGSSRVATPPPPTLPPNAATPPVSQPRRSSAVIREPFQTCAPSVPPKLRASTTAAPVLTGSPTIAPARRPTLTGRISRSGSHPATFQQSPTAESHCNTRSSSAAAGAAGGIGSGGGASVLNSPDSVGDEEAQQRRRQPPRFFRATPRTGEFVPLVEWLLRRGERGDVGAASASPAPTDAGARTQASFYNEDYIAKLCAAATATLAREPSLLELEVLAHDTLVVVGDIHGQFQDLYASVLCQQYDRQRCNPDGRDRRFLFMGDYVDRGPNSLEVVLLLLALKVEYPALVYLTRGNHEEEKTSRVYGFLTEATASLGAEVGAAVWSAVNKVFLDLPLAAVVHTPHMRFFVTHGGLSPGFERVEEICAVERHNYSCGNITAAQDDMITGLLWSDPTSDVPMYKRNPRGCGFLFGPTASRSFCADNNFDFICRAHQVAMEGYIWTHNDRVLTVFSAPNYCGVNGNKGAVLIVRGRALRPIVRQYDSVEREAEVPARKADFAYAAMFA
ncbi:phosphoprotein phosphatase [Novymonas esmeraldas]|uniref:Phosphoprotein phosphatase n=1 Tax=Novymonas esmeraldas TaxID=1808958 RepID=A0AAW0ER61_9TRYP